LDFIEERFFQYALSHLPSPIHQIDLTGFQVLQVHMQGSRTDDEGHLAPCHQCLLRLATQSASREGREEGSRRPVSQYPWDILEGLSTCA
jgi:hypothetical protein